MKKLTHSAAARAVAFILCLLCGLTALLCAAGYYMTHIDRDRTLPEPDSVSVYQNGIRVLLNNALQEERDTGEYPELPSGYSYVATDTSTGKVLYDGRTKNAVPLGISAGYFSEGVGIDVQAYLEPKQTPGFDHFPMAHPGEELTLLRTSVGTLLRYQNAYLPAGIITAVLCIALLVFLMASMGKKPDGVKLRGIHRVPLDLFLAAALAAVAVPANFYFDLSGINLLYNPLWVWMMPVTLMALWIGFVALLTFCTLAARFRAGKWWKNSIIYIVCRFVYRAVRGPSRGRGSLCTRSWCLSISSACSLYGFRAASSSFSCSLRLTSRDCISSSVSCASSRRCKRRRKSSPRAISPTRWTRRKCTRCSKSTATISTP